MNFPQFFKSFLKQNSAFILVPVVSYTEVTAARAAMIVFVVAIVGGISYELFKRMGVFIQKIMKRENREIVVQPDSNDFLYTTIQTEETFFEEKTVVSHNKKLLYVSAQQKNSSRKKTFFEKLFLPLNKSQKNFDHLNVVRQRVNETFAKNSKVIFFKKLSYDFHSNKIDSSTEKTKEHFLFTPVLKNKFDIQIEGVPQNIDTKL